MGSCAAPSAKGDDKFITTDYLQQCQQMRLVWYIYAQRYRDHHDDEFIRRCERVRRQFILTSALCGLVVVSLIALMIWH
ncbi:hypothetical protein [Klebsiella pneumoniae]|uniref:hypothetical protein n=1 Tax=Klebsiella pneumoniae TaxID=573 RepID=UPI002159C97D|nr:hypothetical protein [Klebsiella pneumoniae]